MANQSEIGNCTCIANKLRWYAERALTNEINDRDNMVQQIREMPYEERLTTYGTKWEEAVHLIESGTRELERYRKVVNSMVRCDDYAPAPMTKNEPRGLDRDGNPVLFKSHLSENEKAQIRYDVSKPGYGQLGR